MDGEFKNEVIEGVELELCVKISNDSSRIVAYGSKVGALGGLAILITLIANAMELTDQQLLQLVIDLRADLREMQGNTTNWIEDFIDMVQREKLEACPEEFVKGMN